MQVGVGVRDAQEKSIHHPATLPEMRAPMDRSNVIPGLGGLAHRIFECSGCAHVVMMPRT
jgi:hypothetical protein